MLLEARPTNHNITCNLLSMFCISFAAAHTDALNLLTFISELGMDTCFINRNSYHAACSAGMHRHAAMQWPLLSAMLHCHAHVHKQQTKG